MQASSVGAYEAVAPFLGWDVSPGNFPFDQASAVYEYISYLAAHNSTVDQLLQSPRFTDPATNQSYLYTLRWLADAQQQFLLANMSAYNNISRSYDIPSTPGSISTIAGNTLAGFMLACLEGVINSYSTGQSPQPLSLLFGDFDPLVSLFALMNMTHASSDFIGLPEFASSATFELYSRESNSTASFPDPSKLFVSFHFRNGTGNSSNLLTYPVFGHDPSQTEMSWTDFRNLMVYTMLGTVGDWCTQCHATNLFCAAWNTSLISTSAPAVQASQKQLSNTVAGVIGAIVSLAVAALLFGLVMLFGRVRFHRKPRTEKELRGFKGSAKLASDRDLTLPKNGVVVDTTAADDAIAGHERTGSWEMKNGDDKPAARRASFESDDLAINPFSDPVKAHEQV